jgi:hypothetical protein
MTTDAARMHDTQNFTMQQKKLVTSNYICPQNSNKTKITDAISFLHFAYTLDNEIKAIKR